MNHDSILYLALSGNFNRTLFNRYSHELHKKTVHCSTPLHYAVLGGNAAAVLYFIQNGINVNARNVFGETALHWCGKEGNFELVQVLLDNGADLNLDDIDGNTPVHWAAEYNNIGVLRELLSRGANFNEVNGMGETPMALSVVNEALDSVSLLNRYLTKEKERRFVTVSPIPRLTTKHKIKKLASSGIRFESITI